MVSSYSKPYPIQVITDGWSALRQECNMFKEIFFKMTGIELSDNQEEFISKRWTPKEFENYLWKLTTGPDWKYDKAINWITSK